MTHPSPRTPRPSTSPRAFTLTEIMIALAMVALLLVGISRIFAITSQTIGTGQALSKAVRAQRGIGQALSADIVGTGTSVAAADVNTGMAPLGGGSDKSAPMLLLSNFRVAAYRNETEARNDIGPAVANENFDTRSAHIRGIDLDGNGSDTDAGEVTPLYFYGLRNWRVDTVGFFGLGNFTSQTGLPGAAGSVYQNPVKSNEAFIWYGHLAVFNGQLSRSPFPNAYGLPGSERTIDSSASATILPIGTLPNTNDQYANQFLLGRFQILLVAATDHDGDSNTLSATDKTVVAPDLTPVPFLQKTFEYASEPTTLRTPFGTNSTVKYFNNAISPRTNVALDQNDALLPAGSTPPVARRIENSRCDIAGIASQEWYDRLHFFQTQTFVLPSGARIDYRDQWWDRLFCEFANRYQINPFPGVPFDTRTMSQRSQLLSPDCTQFIVEYAGDFLTQDANGVVQQSNTNTNGGNYAFQPDGILDFMVSNGRRQTRWYGMPRDVNEDGSIVGNTSNTAPSAGSAIYSSPDVIPLRDLLGGRMLIRSIGGTSPSYVDDAPIFRPFEVAVPLPSAQYGTVTAEVKNTTNTTPISNTNVFASSAIDVESTAYICAWGPIEFETQTPINNTANAPTGRPVPQMLRFIVDVTDSQGKLREPVRQEYVFPVPVAK